MALKKNTKTITLSKGMRDDVDQFLLESPNCSLVKNGVFLKEGVISKRRGLEVLATGSPGGSPVGVINSDSGPVVQGTNGLYVPQAGSFSEVDSDIVPSSVNPERSTPVYSDMRRYHFDKVGERFIDIWQAQTNDNFQVLYRMVGDNGKLVEGTFNIISTKAVLSTSCKIIADTAHFVAHSQDAAGIYTNYISYDLTTGVSDTSYSLTHAATGTSLVEVTEDAGITANIHSGAVTSDEDHAKSWAFITSDRILHIYQSGVGKRLFGYSVASGSNNLDQALVVLDDLIGAYADDTYTVSLHFAAGTVSIERRLTSNVGVVEQTSTFAEGSTHIMRAGYAWSGTAHMVSLSDMTALETSSYDQYYQETSYTFADLGNLGADLVVSTSTWVDLTDSGTFAAFGSVTGEQLCAEPLTDGASFLALTVPFVQTPFLSSTTADSTPLSLPLAFKPNSATLYGFTAGGVTLVSVVGANKTSAYDYFKTVRSNFLTSAVIDGSDFYFATRTIDTPPSIGFRTGPGDISGTDSNKYPDKYASYRYDTSKVSLALSSFAVGTPSGTVIPGGTLAMYSGNKLGLASFTNAPEITSVLYAGSWLESGVGTTPLLGRVSCSYDVKDTPSNNGGYQVWVVGFVAVLSATTPDGKKIYSAPSQTLYVPIRLHRGTTVSTGGATDITFSVYSPGVTPAGYQTEVYAFTALDSINEGAGTFSTGAPKLVGVGGNTVTVTDIFDGAVDLDGLSGVPFTDTATTPIYTDSKLASDVPPPVNSAIVSNNRLFYVDRDNIYFSTVLRTDEVPLFPVAFRTPLLRKNPLQVAALDDKVIVFYRNSISVLFGRGPNNLGVGPEFQQQEIPGQVGLLDPNSITSIPQGVMFRSDRGFFLLDRGLVLRFKGGAEDVVKGATVLSAVTNEATSSCIFSLDATGAPDPLGPNFDAFDFEDRPPIPRYGNFAQDGYAAVYNYERDSWSVFSNYDFVAMQDIGGDLVGIRSDWTLLGEYTGYADLDSPASTRQNLLCIRSPWVKFTNAQDYARLYKVTLLGRYYSELSGVTPDAGDIEVTLRHDYSEHPIGTGSLSETFTSAELSRNSVAGAPNRLQIDLRPKRQKCQSVQVTVQEAQSESSSVGRGFEISVVDFLVGVKGGSARLPSGNKK